MPSRLDRVVFEITLIVIAGLLLIIIALINPHKLRQFRQFHGLRFFLGEEGTRIILALVGLGLVAFAASAWLAKN